jgi:trimeric autotransporter adhesin
MKSISQFKRAIPPILITLLLLCFGLLPSAQAVVPPPDGGYPGGNTAEGGNALLSLTTGTNNTAVGLSSLKSDTIGVFNTGIGASALMNNTSGNLNTSNGAFALFSNTTGQFNTAIGGGALFNNTTGEFNTAVGVFAGVQQTTGNNNVYIGYNIQGMTGETNACYIASIFGQTSPDGLPVLINSNNKLGMATSSRRFKQDIKSMGTASETLFALKPVTFRYKKEIDPQGRSQLGLVAEEVEKVNPDLVVLDKEGKPYSVRYEQVNAMLLNEFLKEHCKVAEQEATISELKSTVTKQQLAIAQQRKDFEATVAEVKKEMETVVTRLKEHDARIQTVSNQVELRKAVSEVASISQ